VRPERISLFGSTARGEIRPDSDYERRARVVRSDEAIWRNLGLSNDA